ncbi:MAG: hypothetical protein EBW11_11285, partial [Betaproteobacteria bacterium]|nr:hypothetical protein [Betaproteobacteria bacterium]
MVAVPLQACSGGMNPAVALYLVPLYAGLAAWARTAPGTPARRVATRAVRTKKRKTQIIRRDIGKLRSVCPSALTPPTDAFQRVFANGRTGSRTSGRAGWTGPCARLRSASMQLPAALRNPLVARLLIGFGLSTAAGVFLEDQAMLGGDGAARDDAEAVHDERSAPPFGLGLAHHGALDDLGATAHM